MTKYILVGGRVHGSADGGEAFVRELVKDINHTPKILICLFAVEKDQWKERFKGDQEFFGKFLKDFTLELAEENKFTEQVKNTDILFIRGGYTRPLMELLSKDLSWVKEIDNKIIAGTSAGAEAIAKYYFVTKTNRNGEGLGLLPIKFIPHWKSAYFDGEEQNIDWDKIYNDFKNYKEDLDLLVLREGEFKVFNK